MSLAVPSSAIDDPHGAMGSAERASPARATDPGASAMLIARDLEVTVPGGREPAVRGVSLSVAAGEWVTLTGPNGGGKTTLLLALAGLWPISGGTLALHGVPFGPDNRARSAEGVAVVLQDPSSQLLQSTVHEELAFTARNLGMPEPAIAQAVERWSRSLGLTPELDRDPATLSAGRQQLVLLAAALVPGPRLLVADEPTAHLDEATRSRVREVVAAEVEHGMAVVWATQEPSEMATATRTVTVGDATAGAAPPATAVATPGTPAVVRLRVARDPGGDGPRVRVDHPLEIEVAASGVTALLGPNGVGKSVLLAAAAGVLAPPQVTVEWVATPSEAPILVLQFPDLQIFEEHVADEMVFAAVARGISRAIAVDAGDRALSRLGLPAGTLAGRRTWSLSAGEKRLVETVGALIAPSCLVLLDEPTAGLDRARRRDLAVLISERAGSVPVLIASQDREWAEGLGARTFVLGG